MPEFHSEPYVYLPAISHKSVLVAWGAFYFRVNSSGQMKLVDDDELRHVHPPRKDTIGARSAPYGPVRTGLVGPKRATTGVPIATAICIGPESFVTSTEADAKRAGNRSGLV